MEALHHFLQPTAWTYYTSFIIFAKQHAGHEIPSSGRCQIAGPEDWRMVDMNMYASAHMCEARICTQQFDCNIVRYLCFLGGVGISFLGMTNMTKYFRPNSKLIFEQNFGTQLHAQRVADCIYSCQEKVEA